MRESSFDDECHLTSEGVSGRGGSDDGARSWRVANRMEDSTLGGMIK